MVERRAISVDGIAQGVGFRPFVQGLAARLHLQGFVRNRTGNVRIEVEGECRLRELVIGVTFHGTGYGSDGAVWGGEFLVGDYTSFRRAAHVRYVGLPGGEQAIRQPWRMAASHLLDAQCDLTPLQSLVPPGPLHALCAMPQRRFNTPMTSRAGRLFDAVAALIGLRTAVTYEGQAAAELEWLADKASTGGS